MNYTDHENDDLYINGQHIKELITTLQLKSYDYDSEIDDAHNKIRNLECEVMNLRTELDAQTSINYDMSELLEYSMTPKVFLSMIMNFSQKMAVDEIVDGETILNNTSMVASTVSRISHYGDLSFSSQYWLPVFEKAIEMGVDEKEIIARFVNFCSVNARSAASSSSIKFNVYSNTEKFAKILEEKYNYYNICTYITQSGSAENIMAYTILNSLQPEYRKEYIKYIFKQWDTDAITKHWYFIRASNCTVYRHEYLEMIYKAITKSSDIHHENINKMDSFIRTMRQAYTKIDNYFKLKNQ